MLRIQVEKTFPDLALKLDISLPLEGIAAITGPSGAGKTSFLKMIAGLVQPERGEIYFGEECLFDSQKKFSLCPEKRRFGFVFQEGRLFPHLSVRKNLQYGASQGQEDFLNHLCQRMGIEHLLERSPRALSAGERQRVAIGRALMMRPRLLLLDEPFASLDLLRKTELLDYVRQLSGEFSLPVLYVTHSRFEMKSLSSRFYLLERGQIQPYGGDSL